VIGLSGRYALPTALVLWVLLLPVAYHGIVRPQAEDCADPAALEITRFAPASSRARAKPASALRPGERSFGELVTETRWKNDPIWNLVRTYDLGQSYILPPGRLSLSSSLEESSLQVREVDGVEVPVHLRVETFGVYANIAAHVYVLGGRPVRSPFLASLALAWPQLLHGTLPLTSIVVEGDAPATFRREREALLVEWLLSAWSHYEDACLR
jgi:hypothetical protein